MSLLSRTTSSWYIHRGWSCAAGFRGKRYKSNGTTGDEAVSPRAGDFGRAIEDDYAAIRERYSTALAPMSPIC